MQEPKCAPPSVDQCRSVFQVVGQGGQGTLTKSQIASICASSLVANVFDDLRAFTGLTETEWQKRMQRLGRFHFEGEHLFWNPQSKTELAWFYATSVDYLFANAIHPIVPQLLQAFEQEHGPILDYSGGVGTNVIPLAKLKNIDMQYFGIGMIEYTFAEYRVHKHGVADKVTFLRPFNQRTNFTFDPINGPLPRDESLGAILAADVLEHIPEYHKVVKAMVESIRPGGFILEKTPFGSPENMPNGTEDLRVHLGNGGITMAQAMGPNMTLVPAVNGVVLQDLKAWQKKASSGKRQQRQKKKKQSASASSSLKITRKAETSSFHVPRPSSLPASSPAEVAVVHDDDMLRWGFLVSLFVLVVVGFWGRGSGRKNIK